MKRVLAILVLVGALSVTACNKQEGQGQEQQGQEQVTPTDQQESTTMGAETAPADSVAPAGTEGGNQ